MRTLCFKILVPVLLAFTSSPIFFHASPQFLVAVHPAIAAVNPGDAYNLSPTSRTLAPLTVYTTNGTVSNPNNVLSGQATRLTGNGASVTLDFGKDVGGITTLSFAGASDASQSIGLAFSESSLYVGTTSDASNGGNGTDGAVITAVTGAGTYTVPSAQLRGGFRYLTIFLNSAGWVDLNGVSLAFTAAPTMSNPSQYANYFYSSDDLLNKLWYAGAYTVQLGSIAPTQGRVWGPPSSGWNNSATIGSGTTILVDGAKRDRTVWPGDLGIAVPTAYVSTGDLLSTKNALSVLYAHQNSATGELPYAGPEVNFYGSDTYHLWTLVGTYNYALYSGDKAWFDGIWSQYKQGVTFSTNKIDGNGLLNVTGTGDWARGDQGGENIEANALLYRVLTTGTLLAQIEGDTTLATTYANQAANIKTKINSTLWDARAGAYQDNSNNSSLHPQDGNALAIWFNVIDASAKATSILTNLQNNWNAFGAHTPEWGNISPFTGSMELYARFAANDDANAITLMKREWGYMLNAASGTKSTFWEGLTDSGAFAYNGSYTSLAHGWSTGPTGTLTTDVLGVAPDTTAGQTYHVIPHPADLTHVEGTLTVAPSKVISVRYDHGTAGDFTLHVDTSTNGGSVGVIAVPTFGQSHSVQINGVTAWNGSTFVGASGIASADQDTNYIYFRGAQPGVYTLSYPATTGTQLGVWTQCAAENGSCSFSGTMTVAYGAGSKFTYATLTNGTACTNSIFGDPILGAVKACYRAAAPPTTGVWPQCAAENQSCAFTGTMTVAYGANSAFKYVTATNGVACGNAVFGDPILGTAKSCYLVTPPANAATWTSCAAENQTCAFTGTHEVAFGVNGHYFYGSFTSGTACNVSIFGDPNYGTIKSCFLQ